MTKYLFRTALKWLLVFFLIGSMLDGIINYFLSWEFDYWLEKNYGVFYLLSDVFFKIVASGIFKLGYGYYFLLLAYFYFSRFSVERLSGWGVLKESAVNGGLVIVNLLVLSLAASLYMIVVGQATFSSIGSDLLHFLKSMNSFSYNIILFAISGFLTPIILRIILVVTRIGRS